MKSHLQKSPPAGNEGAAMYTLGVVVNGVNYTLTATRETGAAMASDPCGDLTLTMEPDRWSTTTGTICHIRRCGGGLLALRPRVR